MNLKEIRVKTDKELEQDIMHLKEELFRLRFRKVTDVIESPAVIRDIKKNIAQIKTIQNERKKELVKKA